LEDEEAGEDEADGAGSDDMLGHDTGVPSLWSVRQSVTREARLMGSRSEEEVSQLEALRSERGRKKADPWDRVHARVDVVHEAKRAGVRGRAKVETLGRVHSEIARMRIKERTGDQDLRAQLVKNGSLDENHQQAVQAPVSADRQQDLEKEVLDECLTELQRVGSKKNLIEAINREEMSLGIKIGMMEAKLVKAHSNGTVISAGAEAKYRSLRKSVLHCKNKLRAIELMGQKHQ